MVNVQDVVGIPELGQAIMRFLESTKDLHSACLVGQVFCAAATPFLWRVVRLPEVYVLPRVTRSRRGQSTTQFHEQCAGLLRDSTQSLFVDGSVMARSLLDTMTLWRTLDLNRANAASLALKSKLNKIFDSLAETLVLVPRLRSLAARDMPRMLDIIVLLQQHCPSIESLYLRPHRHDEEAFLFPARLGPTHLYGGGSIVPDEDPLPNVDADIDPASLELDSWKEIFPSGCVPLKNLVNLRPRPGVQLKFDFPHLTVLSLTEFAPRYMSWHVIPERYTIQSYWDIELTPIVALLKGTPNLRYLELSCSPDRWSGVTGFPGGIMAAISTVYRHRGGEPLSLRGLKVGRGADMLGAPTQPNFLSHLTNLKVLEELHLAEWFTEHTTHFYMMGSRDLVFLDREFLPALCKLTIPWMTFFQSAESLEKDPEFLVRISLRISGKPPLPYCNLWSNRWLADRTSPLCVGRIPARALIIDNEDTGPCGMYELVKNLDSPGLQALKTRLLPLRWMAAEPPGHAPVEYREAWEKRRCDQEDLEPSEMMDRLVTALGKLRELRELWLTDGATHEYKQVLRVGMPDQAQIEELVRRLARKCERLRYVRVKNRAWHIHRRVEEGAEPRVAELTEWEVLHCLPEAFEEDAKMWKRDGEIVSWKRFIHGWQTLGESRD